jgi:hypothetical protein
MAKERVQVAQGSYDAPAIQQNIRPVDTYYQPQMGPVQAPGNAGQKLQQLGESLSGLAPELLKFTKQGLKIYSEKEMAEGSRKAAENRTGFNEAIKQGLIKPGQSPWFKIGYDQQRLRIEASDYDSSIRNGYMKGQLQTQENINEFLGLQRSALFDRLTKQGYRSWDINEVLLPKLQAAEQNLASHHATEHAKYIEASAVDNSGVEIGNLIQKYYSKDFDTAKMAVSFDTIAPEVDKIFENYKATGGDMLKFKGAAYKALEGYAYQNNDFRVLSLLDRIKDPVTGKKMGDDPDLQVKRYQAENTIRRNIQYDLLNQHRMEQDERESKVRDVLRQYGQQKISYDEAFKQVLAIDPRQTSYLESLNQRSEEAKNRVPDTVSTRQTFTGLYRNARVGRLDREQADAALASRQITQEEWEKLVDTDEQSRSQNLFTSSEVKSVVTDGDKAVELIFTSGFSGLKNINAVAIQNAQTDHDEYVRLKVNAYEDAERAAGRQPTGAGAADIARKASKEFIDHKRHMNQDRQKPQSSSQSPSQKPAAGSKSNSGTTKPASKPAAKPDSQKDNPAAKLQKYASLRQKAYTLDKQGKLKSGELQLILQQIKQKENDAKRRR